MASLSTACGLLLALAIAVSYCPQSSEAGKTSVEYSVPKNPNSKVDVTEGRIPVHSASRIKRFFGGHRKTKVVVLQQPVQPAHVIVIQKSRRRKHKNRVKVNLHFG